VSSLITADGRLTFAADPYVKFLPLVFVPPQLDWTFARCCDPFSRRRIVVVAFATDHIGYEGWMRFAEIAVHSLLHCSGIDAWAVDVVVGAPPSSTDTGRMLTAALFGERATMPFASALASGVTIKHVDGLLSPGDVYSAYDPNVEIMLRLDADAGCLRKCLSAPAFRFSSPIGHSGLAERHTGRDGLAQLAVCDSGRKRFTETAGPFWTRLQRSEAKFSGNR
jgi:hypothetical protein